MKALHDPTPVFDPFTDRASRDVRNGLSRAFGQALAAGDPTPVEELGAALLAGDLGPGHRDYVSSRLERYRRAFPQIRDAHGDPVRQGLILWDLRLFFEVHEVLEHAWHEAEGDRRRLLQALIRAAGVYIKLEFGQSRQAVGLAEKACAGLEENRDALREHFDPEELIAALRSLNPTPPALLAAAPPAGRTD